MRIVRKMLPYRSKRLFEDYLKGELQISMFFKANEADHFYKDL